MKVVHKYDATFHGYKKIATETCYGVETFNDDGAELVWYEGSFNILFFVKISKRNWVKISISERMLFYTFVFPSLRVEY